MVFTDLKPGSFDVIFMNHVLEHIEEPVGLLESLRGLLAPQGRLFIEVPNVRSLRARLSMPTLSRKCGFNKAAVLRRAPRRERAGRGFGALNRLQVLHSPGHQRNPILHQGVPCRSQRLEHAREVPFDATLGQSQFVGCFLVGRRVRHQQADDLDVLPG